MKVCQRCGASNPLVFDYCGRCGTPLVIRAARPADARSAPATGRNVFVGAAAGAIILGSGIVLAVLLALAANRPAEIPLQSSPVTDAAQPSPSRPINSQEIEVKSQAGPAETPQRDAATPVTAAEPPVRTPAPAPAESRAAAPAPAPAAAEVTVYVTRTGEKYHLAGCRYLRQSRIPMRLGDARRGYSPCSVCDPP
jgi:hypothetical protein